MGQASVMLLTGRMAHCNKTAGSDRLRLKRPQSESMMGGPSMIGACESKAERSRDRAKSQKNKAPKTKPRSSRNASLLVGASVKYDLHHGPTALLVRNSAPKLDSSINPGTLP